MVRVLAPTKYLSFSYLFFVILQALNSLNLRRSCEPKISIAKAVSLWKVVYQGGGERSSRGPDL
jgi:hypothetical protein